MEKVLELIALLTLVFGINIPFFWIPIHFKLSFFRRIGILTYLMPLITLSIIFFIVFKNQDYILEWTIEITSFLNFFGLAIFLIGVLLHLWTAKLLGLWALIGVPEIMPKKESRFLASGPFSIIRHPTYLAHTLIFLGAFLLTEVIAIGILTIFDFLIINALVIPMEERELLNRFGNVYKEYKEKVKWRMIPGLL